MTGEHGDALGSACAEESKMHKEEWRCGDFWSSRIYEFRDWVGATTLLSPLIRN